MFKEDDIVTCKEYVIQIQKVNRRRGQYQIKCLTNYGGFSLGQVYKTSELFGYRLITEEEKATLL
jgi:hypothetical protein